MTSNGTVITEVCVNCRKYIHACRKLSCYKCHFLGCTLDATHNANLVTVGTSRPVIAESSFGIATCLKVAAGRQNQIFPVLFWGAFFFLKFSPRFFFLSFPFFKKKRKKFSVKCVTLWDMAGLLLFQGVRGQSGHQNVLEAKRGSAPALHFNPRTPNLAPDLAIKELGPR